MKNPFSRNEALQHATAFGVAAGAVALGASVVFLPKFFVPSQADRTDCAEFLSDVPEGQAMLQLPDACRTYSSLFEQVSDESSQSSTGYRPIDADTFLAESQDIINNRTRDQIVGGLGLSVLVGMVYAEKKYVLTKKVDELRS